MYFMYFFDCCSINLVILQSVVGIFQLTTLKEVLLAVNLKILSTFASGFLNEFQLIPLATHTFFRFDYFFDTSCLFLKNKKHSPFVTSRDAALLNVRKVQRILKSETVGD